MRYLVIGLGNPGSEYAGTRHNFGFAVVDNLIKTEQVTETKTKLLAKVCVIDKYHGGVISDIGGTIIMKPQNFMNLSGQVTAPFAKKEGIDAKHIIVVHDDLDLPFGEIRISTNSSAGGHNGVQSVIDEHGTKDFTRVRLGIGRSENIPPEDYVLQRFTADEKKRLPEIIGQAVEKINELIRK